MLRHFSAFLVWSTFLACKPSPSSFPSSPNELQEKSRIAAVLDSFNVAAANADFDSYFSFFADSNSTFIGTDATEVWNRNEFMKWAKPHFDKKATWNFTSLNRNITLAPSGSIAWFDERLNTQMKICRGSGVLIQKDGNWRISQYVLSITMPNETLDEAIKIKTPIEDSLINSMLPH